MNFEPKLEEIVTQKEQIVKLQKCIEEKTPVILHGSPGVGKTSSVYAIAKKYGFHIVETNASDERTKDKLKPFVVRVQTKTFNEVIFLFVTEILEVA